MKIATASGRRHYRSQNRRGLLGARDEEKSSRPQNLQTIPMPETRPHQNGDPLIVVGSRAVCQADCSGIGYPNAEAVVNINADLADAQSLQLENLSPKRAPNLTRLRSNLSDTLRSQAHLWTHAGRPEPDGPPPGSL
jgi:hypothetical protein